MSGFLLYHRRTRPTGRRLSRVLGIEAGLQATAVHQHKVLLRWGNASPAVSGDARVVNNPQAILLAGDKYETITRLGMGDVRVPKAWRTCPGEGVILARRRRGFGGTDIQVCGHNPCVPAEWYSEFIPNDREYRLHVVDGEVIRTQRKYLERPDQRHSDFIKNHANGYVFKTPQRPLNSTRLDAAVKSVSALGLDFGAVDMIVDPAGVEHVLEVNTAPACSPLTLSAYAEAFKRKFPQIAGIST